MQQSNTTIIQLRLFGFFSPPEMKTNSDKKNYRLFFSFFLTVRYSKLQQDTTIMAIQIFNLIPSLGFERDESTNRVQLMRQYWCREHFPFCFSFEQMNTTTTQTTKYKEIDLIIKLAYIISVAKKINRLVSYGCRRSYVSHSAAQLVCAFPFSTFSIQYSCIFAPVYFRLIYGCRRRRGRMCVRDLFTGRVMYKRATLCAMPE